LKNEDIQPAAGKGIGLLIICEVPFGGMEVIMKKKLVAVILATMVLCTACSSGKTSDVSSGKDSGSNDAQPTAGATADADSQKEAAEEPSTYDFSDREPVTLKLYMFGDADTAQCELVSEKLSEITREKLNCDVQLTRIGFGSYVTQLNLALSSGEQIDVFSPFNLSTSTLANSGQIKPLTKLLQTYGKETYEAISADDWACHTVGDDIYAVPPNKDKAMDLGFMMRKDIVDELGIDLSQVKDFNGLHDVLVKVKEAHPDMYPAVPDFGNMLGYLEVDQLSDYFGVLLDPYTSDSLKVENLFESEYYKELCTMMYGWAKEGLLMPDASTNTESGNNLIKSGKAFGRFSHMKVGFESENTNAIGMEIVTWKYAPAISVTSKLSPAWCIGENTVDAERSMALLNLMYNDPEVSNLLINGVEGVHYQILDAQKGIIGYPEGKDATTVGYARLPWGWPNEQISYLWQGDSETLWSDLNQFNLTAIQSPAKGFTFDNAMVLNEVTACQNIYTKYNPALLGGQLDPEITIPKFVEELKKAGIGTIIAEKQKQIDAWAANKK